GARTSLFVALAAVLLGTTVGSLWGLACGYLRGRFDLVSQRIMEVLQSFPDLILAMAISMAIGTGLAAVIFAIAITRIPFGGRVIRSVALSVREMAYVEAGRASGASALRIMAFHVLPQCVAPYLVLATTHLGVAIVIEAALGFLGVGVPPPTPTWGNMLADSITALVPAVRLAGLPPTGHRLGARWGLCRRCVMSSGDRLRRGSWAEAPRARYRPRLRRLRAAVRPGDPGVPCPGLLPKPRLHSLQNPCASSLRT